MQGRVASLASSPGHDFSKEPRAGLRLLAGLGVEGDAHCGPTVKHRSRVALDPSQPNLRQVLLLEAERIRSVAAEGYAVGPGTLGENLLTEGLDLHDLPVGTRLE
ncbi:MAG TPA: MOSC domain-containing protein, partial [Myxococcota bacterium]|nr:MOSC domain-containing protein [Myxococcota bacterium]